MISIFDAESKIYHILISVPEESITTQVYFHFDMDECPYDHSIKIKVLLTKALVDYIYPANAYSFCINRTTKVKCPEIMCNIIKELDQRRYSPHIKEYKEAIITALLIELSKLS